MTSPTPPAQPTPPDLRAELLEWIEAREKECAAATPGPWFESGATWNELMLLGGPRKTIVCDPYGPNPQDRPFLMSSRTALPLALKALRETVEVHQVFGPECLKCEFCTDAYGDHEVWPCLALRRLHVAIIGGSK